MKLDVIIGYDDSVVLEILPTRDLGHRDDSINLNIR